MSTPPQFPAYPLPYATPQGGPPRKRRAWLGWLLFVAIALVLFLSMKQQNPVYQTIPLSDFTDQLERGGVSQIMVDGDELTGKLVAPRLIGGQMVTTFRTYLPTGSGGSWAFAQWLLANRNGATIRAEPNNNILVNFILPFIPWLLILAFIWFFVFRQLRSQFGPKQPMPVVIINPEQRP